MISRQTSTLRILFLASDISVMVLCFFLAFFLKKHVILPDPYLDLEMYKGLIAIEVPFVLVVLIANGLYSSKHIQSDPISQIMLVGKCALQVFAVLVVVGFYAKMFSYSRVVFTLFLIFLPLGLAIPRLAAAKLRWLFANGTEALHKVLIFGDSELTPELMAELSRGPYYSYKVTGVAGKDGLDYEQALDMIEQGKVDSVILNLSLNEFGVIEKALAKADKEGISVFMSAGVLPSTMLNLSRVNLGSIPLIALRPPDLPVLGKETKRILDVTLSFAMLLLSSPLFAIIGLAIKLTSKGPVFYTQTRVGYDGREFTIIKFRTMIEAAEADTGPVWAKAEDDRVTAAGRLLRRTNLDELPQLVNVFLGSMSLVGPRPERPEFVSRFKDEIGRYAHKHWVKPGMTGWAQLNGLRGNTDLNRRIEYDLYYIENWSIWLDLKILALTPFFGFRNAM